MKDNTGTPLGSNVCKLSVTSQCSLKAGRLVVLFLKFLSLFHVKTTLFTLHLLPQMYTFSEN